MRLVMWRYAPSDEPPPPGPKLTNPPVYYDINTTAAFSGAVRVCLGWTEGRSPTK